MLVRFVAGTNQFFWEWIIFKVKCWIRIVHIVARIFAVNNYVFFLFFLMKHSLLVSKVIDVYKKSLFLKNPQ